MFSRWLSPPGQLLHPGQQAVGERGEVVARVQHVGLAAFPLLLPHEVRAGREERAQALAVELQDDAPDGQHHPDGDQDEVWVRGDGRSRRSEDEDGGRRGRVRGGWGWGELTDGLEGHVGEGGAEVGVQEAFEDVERDVGEAGVDVGVGGQDHRVSADHSARQDVALMHGKDSDYICSEEGSTGLTVRKSLSGNISSVLLFHNSAC